MIINTFLDIIYPMRCLICGAKQQPEGNNVLCLDCISKAKRNEPPFCLKCGRSLINNRFYFDYCSECRCAGAHFTQAWSCFIYEGVMKESIKLFKYRGRTALAKPLSDLMTAFMDRFIIDKAFDLIMPVPLHRNKYCQRGFNQSELLSKNISKTKGVPVAYDLVKTRNTGPQNALNKNDRLSNLNNAFSVKDARQIQKKTVLLIDDVITTCSTVNECAKTLIDSGSGRVYAFSLARGV